MGKTVTMNVKVKDYTNRVVGVVKEKYGLKDKAEALDKFADLYGEDFVDKEVRDDVIKEVIASCARHFKKYGYNGMTLKELDQLTQGK